MSTERFVHHISKRGAAIAVISGALIGSGVAFPPAAGLGVAVGAAGLIYENGRKTRLQFENFDDYLDHRFPDPETTK